MGTYLKRVAAVLNAALLVVGVIALLQTDNPLNGKATLLAILVLVAPIASLTALFAPEN